MKMNRLLLWSALFFVGIFSFSCTKDSPSVSVEGWGQMGNRVVSLFVLKNANGMEAHISDYGCTVQKLLVPTKKKEKIDLFVGYDTFEEYRDKKGWHATVVGRVANRIANGKFAVDGKEYQIAQNNGVNALHGGTVGLDSVLWTVQGYGNAGDRAFVKFAYISPHLESGFPGTVRFDISFSLTNEGELIIETKARSDERTPIALSFHPYINLNGQGNGTIESHMMKINAGAYTPVDETLIPTGELAPVDGTPFDFRVAKAIGSDLNSGDWNENVQLKHVAGPLSPVGYDHNWVIDGWEEEKLREMAVIYEEKTGIMLKVFGDSPGMQLYSGNFMGDGTIGKGGKPFIHRGAMVLEPQNFPNAVNQSNFPSPVVEAGEVYEHTLVYQFLKLK